jgi:hypothetical protein
MRTRPPGSFEFGQRARLDPACRHPDEVLLHRGLPSGQRGQPPIAGSFYPESSASERAAGFRYCRSPVLSSRICDSRLVISRISAGSGYATRGGSRQITLIGTLPRL